MAEPSPSLSGDPLFLFRYASTLWPRFASRRAAARGPSSVEAERALPDEDLEAVDDLAPAASPRPERVSDRRRRARRRPRGGSIRRAAVVDRRRRGASPTDVPLTTRSAAPAPRRVATPHLGRQRPRPLGRAVPDRHLGARLAQRPGRGPRRRRPRPGPARRMPRGLAGSASIRPPASVLSAAIAPPAKVSVLAAPIARGRVGRLVGTASAACLCGIVTLRPR